jgi:uncharacterized protein YndB with AHSA1/START domain
MKSTGSLRLTIPTDQQIVLTRLFNAPRSLVFDAWTKPKYLARWWGQSATPLVLCEVDLRPGGAWRFVERGIDGKEYSFHGEYREVLPPERLVYTFVLDEEGWRQRPVLVTVTFEEWGRKTKFRQEVLHQTVEDRDAYLQAGMERGAAASYDKLAELLASEAVAT